MYPNLSWPLPPLHSLLALITRSVVTLIESAAGNSASELDATKLGSDSDVLGSLHRCGYLPDGWWLRAAGASTIPGRVWFGLIGWTRGHSEFFFYLKLKAIS